MIVMQRCSRGLRELCGLLGYSRQAYYQYQKSSANRALKEDLVIQQVLHHRAVQPRLGCRKLLTMMEPFMREHAADMGRDQLFDLLRDNNLLIRNKKRNKPLTTDSRHWMRKYPDLTKSILLNRADELWVSDITYLQLSRKAFGYLSLVTDAYSRKIVGFYLSDNLSVQGPLHALKMALQERTSTESLIHHSDRGSQYCSDSYVRLLRSNRIHISMTQSGNPKDNAIAERVNGILKQELLMAVYPGIRQARQSVTAAIDIYNRIRPHSSIDMMTPEKAHTQTGSIRRRWKTRIYKQKQEAP